MDKLSCRARAKVNLCLDVCGRRPNGYHDVKMVMQQVDVYDELEFKKLSTPDIILSVDSKDFLGELANNLIFRAVKLVREIYSIKDGVEITLKKNIPVAAGLAGGSTDAAAAFLAMNELFELNITRDELMDMAVRLGADIPFCIMGGTALSEGIGEILTPLPKPPKAYVVLAKPPIMVSTADVYKGLDLEALETRPDVDGMVSAIKEGDLLGITTRMENVLETVTVKNYPVIEELKTMMLEGGALNAMMSGSGPTVFGIFEDKDSAEAIAATIRDSKKAKDIMVTTFYNEDTL